MAPSGEVYTEACPPGSSKKPSLIRSMMARRLSCLHVLEDESNAAGMAVTGKLDDLNALLIDYLAVQSERRGHEIGRTLPQHIGQWAIKEQHLHGVVIEVEADGGGPNNQRIRFWQSCGYELTSYVYQLYYSSQRSSS